MQYRLAQFADIPALAEAYLSWVREEGVTADSAAAASPAEAEKLFWDWLGAEHRAVLFEQDGRLAGYALYLPAESEIRLLQFFVRRELRSTEAAQVAIALLSDEVWPPQARVLVEASVHNGARLDLWRSLGFQDHSVTLERLPIRADEESEKAG